MLVKLSRVGDEAEVVYEVPKKVSKDPYLWPEPRLIVGVRHPPAEWRVWREEEGWVKASKQRAARLSQLPMEDYSIVN